MHVNLEVNGYTLRLVHNPKSGVVSMRAGYTDDGTPGGVYGWLVTLRSNSLDIIRTKQPCQRVFRYFAPWSRMKLV